MEELLEPFKIAVSERDLDDLRERIKSCRWLDDFGNDGWQYGMNGTYLKSLAAYWADDYDWRHHEAEINAYDQYRIVIDDVLIHFLWVRARKPASAALILSHGWPWTFWDYRDVIPLLSDPEDGPAFDLVIPSLPGFGFSTPLRKTGVNAMMTADLWAKLMTRLGYDRFGAVGGDWGAIITANLNHAHADRLIGAYQSFSFIPGVELEKLTAADYDSPGEEDWHQRVAKRSASTKAHLAVNMQAPQTVGYAFNDSPVGLAAWIVERRRLWSAWEGDFETVLSKDMLLTGVSIWWFGQSVGTAGRYAEEYGLHPFEPRHSGKLLPAPTAFGIFPDDLLLLPRTLVEKHANLKRWTVMPVGGHFAPVEQPRLLADDVQAFFGEQLEHAHDPATVQGAS